MQSSVGLAPLAAFGHSVPLVVPALTPDVVRPAATPCILASVITIGLLGLFIDTAISHLNNHLLRWHRGLEH